MIFLPSFISNILQNCLLLSSVPATVSLCIPFPQALISVFCYWFPSQAPGCADVDWAGAPQFCSQHLKNPRAPAGMGMGEGGTDKQRHLTRFSLLPHHSTEFFQKQPQQKPAATTSLPVARPEWELTPAQGEAKVGTGIPVLSFGTPQFQVWCLTVPFFLYEKKGRVQTNGEWKIYMSLCYRIVKLLRTMRTWKLMEKKGVFSTYWVEINFIHN